MSAAPPGFRALVVLALSWLFALFGELPGVAASVAFVALRANVVVVILACALAGWAGRALL